jgi:hypothetical protein
MDSRKARSHHIGNQSAPIRRLNQVAHATSAAPAMRSPSDLSGVPISVGYQSAATTLEDSFEWIARHGIFLREEMGSGTYEDSIFMPAAE